MELINTEVISPALEQSVTANWQAIFTFPQ